MSGGQKKFELLRLYYYTQFTRTGRTGPGSAKQRIKAEIDADAKQMYPGSVKDVLQSPTRADLRWNWFMHVLNLVGQYEAIKRMSFIRECINREEVLLRGIFEIQKEKPVIDMALFHCEVNEARIPRGNEEHVYCPTKRRLFV